MNPETKSASARLQRIKIVSRIVRWVVLSFLVFTVWMLLRLFPYFSVPQISPDAISGGFQYYLRVICCGLASLVYQAVLCFWFWKLARLFRFYERSLIFAFETIGCIRDLGVLCMAGWIFLSLHHFLYQPPFNPTVPPGVKFTMTTHTYRLGFFSFDFGTGIDFGVLLAGVAIVIIAWIMDEGRKIQEEQELTV